MVEKEKGCNAANCDKHCSLCYLWVIPEGLVLYRGLRRKPIYMSFRHLPKIGKYV